MVGPTFVVLIWFLIGIGVPTLLVLLAAVFYLRAVGSRKQYQCPHCGERMQVELMDASHCNHCGAPLQRSESL